MFYKRKYLFLCTCLAFNLLFFAAKGQDINTIVNKLSEGLGNKQSLAEARFLMFSCISEAHEQIKGEHLFLYDWKSKNCRFDGNTGDGKSLTVLFNAANQSGEVFIDQEKTRSPEILKLVREMFSLDSYFLFTPILIANRSVHPVAQDSEIIDSRRYYVLRVNSMANNGNYSELFIDSQSGNISYWKTFDKSTDKTYEFITSKIKDVGGGLTLATRFTDKKNGKIIEYPVVSALLNIEPEKFKTP